MNRILYMMLLLTACQPSKEPFSVNNGLGLEVGDTLIVTYFEGTGVENGYYLHFQGNKSVYYEGPLNVFNGVTTEFFTSETKQFNEPSGFPPKGFKDFEDIAYLQSYRYVSDSSNTYQIATDQLGREFIVNDHKPNYAIRLKRIKLSHKNWYRLSK